MRWKAPEVGDVRKKKRFLFLPKEIGGETRWMECAEWIEVFRSFKSGNGYGVCCWSAVG